MDTKARNYQKVTLRDPETFPEELKFLLDLITINEVPKVVGSYAFKEHKYPSDVDVFERVTVKYDREEALNFYVSQFQNIIQKLLVYSDKAYINDFKAGTLGVNGDGEPIRWTATEVLQGYCIRNNRRYIFRSAISQPAVLKLDIISYISNKFQSIEVFYNIRYTRTNDSNIEEVDFYPLGSYTKNLLEDINKYSTPEYYAPLKVAKRLWALSRVTDCTDLIEAINPLLSSNAAALNQIKSDIEVINDLLYDMYTIKRNEKPLSTISEINRGLRLHKHVDLISLQILNLYKRLSNHLPSIRVDIFFRTFDLVFNEWVEYSISGSLALRRISNHLKLIVKLITDEINIEAKNYVDMINNMNITCNFKFKAPTE